MQLDIKKLVLAIIFTSILFILFLGYAFNSIQKVELDIEIMKGQEIDSKLSNIAKIIIDNNDVAFCDDISMQGIGTNILLVNHESDSACIISNQSVFAVEYEKLDKNMINCNNFIVLVNDVKTVIINCDDLLGNTVARAITAVYHYEYGGMERLNPESVVHFQTTEQDEQVGFLRYAMIESAKSAYFNGEKLDSFYYYYDQWVDNVGLNQYKEVINYDYYDGLKAYITAKVLVVTEKDFSLEEYLNSYKNQYGIYSKDNEFAIMGLMWCLIADKQGNNVLLKDDQKSELYKMMLEGIPLGEVDDKKAHTEYAKKFILYQKDIQRAIELCKDDVATITPVTLIMVTETYDGTIKVDNNHYIYINYVGIDSDHNLIEKKYLTIEIQPYSLKYYILPGK